MLLVKSYYYVAHNTVRNFILGSSETKKSSSRECQQKFLVMDIPYHCNNMD